MRPQNALRPVAGPVQSLQRPFSMLNSQLTRPVRAYSGCSSGLPAVREQSGSAVHRVCSPAPAAQRIIFSTLPRLGARRFASSQVSRARPVSPPGISFRRRVDRIPPNVVLYVLIGLNLLVFLAWNYAHGIARQYRDPTWMFWMRKNFIASVENLQQGRVWTLLTSVFSHSGTQHLAFNMLSLYFAADGVMQVIGVSRFLALYVVSGVVSSLTYLSWNAISGRAKQSGAEGASGAVLANLAFFAACFPQTRFLLFLVVPVPAWACVGGVIAWDLYSTLQRPDSMIASAGHLGGIATGLLYFLRLSRRI